MTNQERAIDIAAKLEALESVTRGSAGNLRIKARLAALHKALHDHALACADDLGLDMGPVILSAGGAK